MVGLMMRNKEVSKIIEMAVNEGRDFLFEHEAKALCNLYDMPVTKISVAGSEEEAVKAAEEIGYPIVLKIVSPQVLHKSDAGGVLVNMKNEEDVRNGYNTILKNVKTHVPTAEITGILVQEMAPNGTEVIIGSTKDPTFGPTIMFGLGGIFVEILKDVSFRIIPINRTDAEDMVKEIKAYKILEGVRGNPPSDVKAILDILMATSRMLIDCPEVSELDMNPLIVYEKGAKIVDARIIL
jgi:acetyl-CoA synthetase (ADP-forming)